MHSTEGFSTLEKIILCLFYFIGQDSNGRFVTWKDGNHYGWNNETRTAACVPKLLTKNPFTWLTCNVNVIM